MLPDQLADIWTYQHAKCGDKGNDLCTAPEPEDESEDHDGGGGKLGRRLMRRRGLPKLRW